MCKSLAPNKMMCDVLAGSQEKPNLRIGALYTTVYNTDTYDPVGSMCVVYLPIYIYIPGGVLGA